MGKESRLAQETHAIKLRLYREKNTVLVYGKDVPVELQEQVFRTAFFPRPHRVTSVVVRVTKLRSPDTM